MVQRPAQHQHFVAHHSSLTSTVPDSSKTTARQAPLKLDIIIVGCGLGGLAAAHCLGKAGHKVRVVEQAPAIGEVGAGIQVSPNVSRLLIRWGLGEALEKIAVRPESLVFRRYSDGKKVGYTRWGQTMTKNYNAPYYHIHRADFHKLLLDLAAPYMTLHLNSIVTSVSTSTTSSQPRPVIHLADGRSMTCDLLIGADGVKSLLRTHVLNHNTLKPDAPRPTGDAAYRAIIPTSLLLPHPELRSLVEKPEMTGWMGPGRHIMGYCIRGKEEYNLVLLHPDKASRAGGEEESWTLEGSADIMRSEFSDFEPRIQKLLSFIPTTLKWKLMGREPLDRWGAAMAVEDAAVLGNLFSRLESYDQITPLLQAYFDLRHPRATATQLSSQLNQTIFHLPDGPEQEKRDREMEAAMKGELELELEEAGNSEDESRAGSHSPSPSISSLSSTPSSTTLNEYKGNPNQWADKEKNTIQFLYDADRVADEWWESEDGKKVRQLPSRSLAGKGGDGASRVNEKASGSYQTRSGFPTFTQVAALVAVFVQCLAIYTFLV